MSQKEIVICSPMHTTNGIYGGRLKDVPAPNLGEAVIRETLESSDLAADPIQTLVMVNVIPADIAGRGYVTQCSALALEIRYSNQ